MVWWQKYGVAQASMYVHTADAECTDTIIYTDTGCTLVICSKNIKA